MLLRRATLLGRQSRQQLSRRCHTNSAMQRANVIYVRMLNLCGFERITMQLLQPMQPEPNPAFIKPPAHAAGLLLFDPVVLGTISPCSAAACWSARFPV